MTADGHHGRFRSFSERIDIDQHHLNFHLVTIRSKAFLALAGALLLAYAGIYVYFSAHGKYGLEYPGSLIEGPIYAWQPAIIHDRNRNEWNRPLPLIFFSLILLDRSFWHRTIDPTPESHHFLHYIGLGYFPKRFAGNMAIADMHYYLPE
jgi:hypothetical protein